MTEIIDLWLLKGSETAMEKIQSGVGWSLMDSIRSGVIKAQNEERGLLSERTQFKKSFLSRLNYIFFSGGILSFILLSAIFFLLKREILQRRKIEEELRIHQHHLNELVIKRTAELNTALQRWFTTLASIGDAVIATDEKGIISFINPMAETITGWTRGEAIGQEVDKVFHIINEQSLVDLECPVRNVLAEGMIKHPDNPTLLVARDGRKIPVDENGAPIKDENGIMTGVILVFRDITVRRMAEKALQESEERFSKAFHNNPAAISIFRLSDGKLADVNESFVQLFKYNREEVIGRTSNDLNLFVNSNELIDLLIEKGKIAGFESLTRTREGDPVFLLTSGEKILINGQNHVLYSSVDVTERKKMEEALQESEQKLKYHLENSPLAVVEWDSNYVVTQWSKEAERIFGWKASETVGQYIGSLNMICEEDVPIVERTMERFSSGKELTVVSTNRNYTSKGNLIICTWYNSVLLNNDGKMSSVLSLIEDITERREAEMELKRAQEKLEMALESGNIGVWEWDLISDEQIWDIRMEKMFDVIHYKSRVYKDFEELIHEEDLTHFRRAVSNSLEMDIPFETVFRTKEFNGQSRYINTKALVKRNTEGKPQKMLGVCFDITGMKKGVEQGLIKLHEELLRSNKELERFAYVASHDLQEPLRMVSSYTQLLQKRYNDKLDQDAKDYIKYAVDGANRMNDLIHGLLAYSRIHTKGKEFNPVDMQQIMNIVLMNLRVKISERNADIQINELPVIMADQGQMVQLIQNLVINAIKFSKNPPKISIGSKSEGDYFTILVKDEGIGIAPEYFERIFHLFQRLMPRDEYEGTGLGLAICKRIVERHGGTIWLESQPGKGTTFFFTIPKKISQDNLNLKTTAENISQELS